MDQDWITDQEKFDVLTDAIQRTIVGGVLRKSDLNKSKIETLEQGVTDNVVSKKKLYKCDCGKRYTLKNLPGECSCGQKIPESPDPDVTHYVSDAYPDKFRQVLGTQVNGFEIKYDRQLLEEVPIHELEPSPSDQQYIHISPFFEIEGGVHIYPNYEDFFISWDRIEDLITDWGSVQDDLQNFLEFVEDGRRLEVEEDASLITSNPQYTDQTMDTSWYTKLHYTDKDTANKQSKARFERNYNLQFERLGNECLRLLFPRAITLQAGGDDQPDGYLLFNDRAYIVESKCYSNGFKISGEQDKANRYVKRFTEMDSERSGGYNLCGYIFVSHEFNQNEFEKDLRSFKQSTKEYVNLDIICLNDRMMEYAAEQLPEFYRNQPSAPQRIYENSEYYDEMLEWLHEITGPETLDVDSFKTYIDIIKEEARENMTTTEEEIAKALKRGSSIGKAMDKAFAD